jgi:hypothetical protein
MQAVERPNALPEVVRTPEDVEFELELEGFTL